MKLQHLTVIFIIIIVPISLVLSEYLHVHIQTIEYQTQYTTRLINATYDASQAFQINTQKNRYSTLSDSKIRDITAAINTFYNTLGSNMGNYTSEELKGYTPAILCTLYDGYYIYTNYYDTQKGEYTYGLKPFVSYSCRYKKNGGNDFVVNYTLDNTITIIGEVNNNYVTKTGHLINTANIPANLNTEILSETIIVLDDSGNSVKSKYEYVIYNNQKVYKESDNSFFYYSTENKKDYVNSADDKANIKSMFENGGSSSAKKYYAESIEFTNWVNSNLYDITQDNAVDSDGNAISDFSTTLGSNKIFNINDSNDPLLTSSTFNEHRMNVIRKSIETNLIPAIATYNTHSEVGYEFAMPKIEEDEWYKIENNVCFVSFLQGLPIKSKTYNNYCVVANNTNEETVGEDSIYIIDSNGEYHKPGCKKLINELNSGSVKISGAYSASDFVRQSVSKTGEDANASKQINDSETGTNSLDTEFFFPQKGTSCYDCIVNIADTYTTDDIIKGGTVQLKDSEGKLTGETVTIPEELHDKYITALARCRYDLYTVNGYFGI